MTPEDLPDGRFDQLGAVHRLVRDRRKTLGLNLRDAAEQIGVSFNSLSRVERGYPPDSPSLLAILRWLGLPVGWLDDGRDLDAAAVGEQWAYWRGWQDSVNAHRAAVDSLAPSLPQFTQVCSECGGRPKRGLIKSEDGKTSQCEGCYQLLAAGPVPSAEAER